MRRFHFTIALAATLTGCTCFAPQQASQVGSKPITKSEKAIAVKKESLRHRRNAITHTKIVQSAITAKMQTPLQPDDKSNAELKESIAAKAETPQSSQTDGESNGEVNMKSVAAKTQTSQSSQLDDEVRDKKCKGSHCSKNGKPGVCCVSRYEARRQERCIRQFYRHDLRPRQGEISRRHRRQAVPVCRSKRQGVHRRLHYSDDRVPQYLQLRTEHRPS